MTDEDLFARFPAEPIDHDNKHYYRGLVDQRLVLDRCGHCGHWFHPPLPMCPSCWSTDVRPAEVSGRGVIYLLSIMHTGPPTPGIDYSTPYPVAAVELAEQPGLRFTSGVIGDRKAVAIGVSVVLAWVERDGNPFPVFRVEAEGTDAGEASR